MKIVFLIMISFVVFSCNLLKTETPTHIALVDKVTKKFSKELWKKENLQQIGHGGMFSGAVREIDLIYAANGRVDVSEARRLLVQSVSRLFRWLTVSSFYLALKLAQSPTQHYVLSQTDTLVLERLYSI